MANALDHWVAAYPFRLGVEDNQCQAWRILDRGAVLGEENNRKGCTRFELALDELTERWLDVRLLVERCPPVADNLLQGCLVVDAIAVRADLANEEPGTLEGCRSVVDGRGIDIGLTECETQFG